MKALGMVVAAMILVAACGGSDDTSAGDTSGSVDSGTPSDAPSNTPDPCALLDSATMEAYFGSDAIEGESGQNGPILNCSWKNESANSVLIQVAADFPISRPDPCPGCIDLTFPDDGYAWDSPLQSGASFVVGSTYYSVTTTGFRDDVTTIAELAQTVYENAGS